MTVSIDVDGAGVVYRCDACGAQLTDPPGAPPTNGRAFIAEHRSCRHAARPGSGR